MREDIGGYRRRNVPEVNPQSSDYPNSNLKTDNTMSIRISLTVILTFLLLSLPGCAGVPDEGKVIRVIDGDTVVIQGGHHIRYIGIDTPEKGDPYYAEATGYNKALVDSRTVRLETDVTDRDKYGRSLRYVYVGNIFVNLELVKHGYAEVYPRDTFPDNKHYDVLKEAETAAKRAGKGMWANPTE